MSRIPGIENDKRIEIGKILNAYCAFYRFDHMSVNLKASMAEAWIEVLDACNVPPSAYLQCYELAMREQGKCLRRGEPIHGLSAEDLAVEWKKFLVCKESAFTMAVTLPLPNFIF